MTAEATVVETVATFVPTDRGGLEALHALACSPLLEAPIDRFLFLRHGRTAGNHRKVYQHPDDPLDNDGHAQAVSAAARLKAVAFDRIVASDMARAWLTAGKVAAATGKPVHAEPRLRERYFGDLIGRPLDGFDWACIPPNGETLEVFVERTRDGLLAAFDGPGTPLVVAHGGVQHVLRACLGLAPIEPHLSANALPMLFERRHGAWTATPV